MLNVRHQCCLPRLNICLDIPLAQGFLDAQLHGVLPSRCIAFGEDYNLARDLSPFVCQRLDDPVVDIKPVFPWEISQVNAHTVEASFPTLDHDTTAMASPSVFLPPLCHPRLPVRFRPPLVHGLPSRLDKRRSPWE